MGVGVYTSDFHGTGGCILVDGPLPTEADHASYVEEVKKDGEDDALDYDAWAQQEVDDSYEFLKETLATAAAKLGFRAAGRQDRAEFDREFVAIADGGPLAIGLRSWQHDYVVGVGAIDRRMPEADGLDFVYEKGRTEEAWRAIYDKAAQDLIAYLRISLQQDGHDVRVRTSGYTTAQASKSEDPELHLERLRVSITEAVKALDLDPELALKDADRAGRVAIVAACEDAYGDGFPGVKGEISPVVPVYDPEHDSITLFSPYEVGPASQMIVPEALRGIVSTFEGDDALFPIPRNEATEDWFKSYRTRGMTLLVDAAEFAEGARRDCVVAWNDDPEVVEVTLHSFEAPAPAP